VKFCGGEIVSEDELVSLFEENGLGAGRLLW